MKNTDYCTVDKGQLPEVAKSRLKEYRNIRAKVDAKAKRRTRKELGMQKMNGGLARAIPSGNTRRKSCARNTT